MSISINTTDLIEIAGNLADDNDFMRPMLPYVKEAGDELLAHVREEAPYRTGKLSRATGIKVGKDLDTTIETSESVPYAKFVYGGTAAHEIYPKMAGGTLVFLGTGGAVFSKHVHIPAQAANPYIMHSWERHKEEYTKALEEGATTVIQKELTP